MRAKGKSPKKKMTKDERAVMRCIKVVQKQAIELQESMQQLVWKWANGEFHSKSPFSEEKNFGAVVSRAEKAIELADLLADDLMETD